MKTERRRAERLRPPGNVLLLFNCNQLVFGRLHSISRLGVGAEYEDGICRPKMGQELIIRIVDERQPSDSTSNIRCIPVYDIPTLSHRQTFKGKAMRQSGMRFMEMNPADHARIRQLLRSLSIPPD